MFFPTDVVRGCIFLGKRARALSPPRAHARTSRAPLARHSTMHLTQPDRQLEVAQQAGQTGA